MLYAFDGYQLDTQRYELRHGGALCALERQGFNVLVYLVQHRDRVVTKDELMEQLWPNQSVSESTLTQRLRAARRALGDSGRDTTLDQDGAWARLSFYCRRRGAHCWSCVRHPPRKRLWWKGKPLRLLARGVSTPISRKHSFAMPVAPPLWRPARAADAPIPLGQHFVTPALRPYISKRPYPSLR